MLNVVEILDRTTPADEFERGLLLPVPDHEKNSIVFEARDGSTVQSLTASAVTFSLGSKTALRDSDIRLDLFVTDARFALACSKYDKGGGWSGWGLGGLAVAVVANTVSHARAAARRHGKMLVGQVRYPWLERVGSSPKKGFGSNEKLYLELSTPSGRARLTLTLPKNIDAAKVAAEIARRAAAYRLATESASPEATQTLTQLRGAHELPPGANASDIQWFVMPNPHTVDEASARLQPGAGSPVPAMPPPTLPPPAAHVPAMAPPTVPVQAQVAAVMAPPPPPSIPLPPPPMPSPATLQVAAPPPSPPTTDSDAGYFSGPVARPTTTSVPPEALKICRQPYCGARDIPTGDRYCQHCGVITESLA